MYQTAMTMRGRRLRTYRVPMGESLPIRALSPILVTAAQTSFPQVPEVDKEEKTPHRDRIRGRRVLNDRLDDVAGLEVHVKHSLVLTHRAHDDSGTVKSAGSCRSGSRTLLIQNLKPDSICSTGSIKETKQQMEQGSQTPLTREGDAAPSVELPLNGAHHRVTRLSKKSSISSSESQIWCPVPIRSRSLSDWSPGRTPVNTETATDITSPDVMEMKKRVMKEAAVARAARRKAATNVTVTSSVTVMTSTPSTSVTVTVRTTTTTTTTTIPQSRQRRRRSRSHRRTAVVRHSSGCTRDHDHSCHGEAPTVVPGLIIKGPSGVCWKCRRPGHIKRACTNPAVGVHCNSCGALDVKVQKCQQCAPWWRRAQAKWHRLAGDEAPAAGTQ